jgi:hypothetical protein
MINQPATEPITIEYSPSTSGPSFFPWEYDPASGADFVSALSGTVTIGVGDTEASVTFAAFDDDQVERTERFDLQARFMRGTCFISWVSASIDVVDDEWRWAGSIGGGGHISEIHEVWNHWLIGPSRLQGAYVVDSTSSAGLKPFEGANGFTIRAGGLFEDVNFTGLTTYAAVHESSRTFSCGASDGHIMPAAGPPPAPVTSVNGPIQAVTGLSAPTIDESGSDEHYVFMDAAGAVAVGGSLLANTNVGAGGGGYTVGIGFTDIQPWGRKVEWPSHQVQLTCRRGSE